MKASNLSEVYEIFDPQEPLKDKKLKEYYVERESPIDNIIRAIRSTPKPSKILFTGTSGNGKTTELNRLIDELKNDFFVISFSIDDRLDMMDVKYVDVLLAIGSEIYEIVTEEIELDGDLREELDNWSERIVELINEEQEGLELGTGFSAILRLMTKIKSQSTTKDIMRKTIEPRISDLIVNINKIIFVAESDEGLGNRLLVVVDDLDKITPKQAEDLFFGHATALIQPACKIVYTVPITTPFSNEFQRVIRYYDDHQILPNINVFEEDGALNKDNYKLLEKIALNRMDGSLISVVALGLTIKRSGGILQDFIRMIRNSANVASEKERKSINIEDVERIIPDIRNNCLGVLGTKHLEILRKIKSEHGRSGGKIFRDILYNLVILERSIVSGMMYTQQLKEFLNELRLAKGRNCLIFAIAANSEEFVKQAESYDLRVNKIYLNGNINRLEVLSNWENTDERTVYFVEGIRNQFPWILGYLNLYRDIFYEIKRPVVIFGSEYEITEVTKYAPDLWRFRSGTYDFTKKKEMRTHVHYDLPIFREEGEDEINERIKVDNYLLEIVKDDHKRAELYMSLVISYLKLQEFKIGKECFDKALEVRRKLNDNIGISIDYTRFGDFYLFKREYGRAIEYYREAISIYLDNVAAHNNLGISLNGLKQYAEAEKEYMEAIRINQDDAEVHYNLGNLLYDLKRYDEAEKEYREAIRIYPDDTTAHNNLGNLLCDLERYGEAEKEYMGVLSRDPDHAKAHYNLGNLLKGLKRYGEAEKEYREAIRIDPDDTEVRYNLGNLLYDLKRYDETEKEYREVMRMDPDDAEARVNLGILFLEIEIPEKAKKEFAIAKELFKNQGNGEDVKKVEELLANI